MSARIDTTTLGGIAPTESAYLAALRARFSAPEYALVSHVRNGTGFQRTTRTADALAMSLWPSRGLEFHGIEIKVSRGDWLRELKDPAKAEEIGQFCERWWIAAPPTVVRAEELPKAWGLLVAKAGKLVVAVDAPARATLPITRPFLAALMRASTEQSVDKASIDEAVGAALMKAAAEWKENDRRESTRLQGRLEEVTKNIADFETASGVAIDRWGGGDIGAAVRTVLAADGKVGRITQNLEFLHEQAKRITETIGEALKKAGAPS